MNLVSDQLTILVLAIFLGFEVISKVPPLLHTPLMSGTNAIHGIVIVGAILVAGQENADTLTRLGFVACSRNGQRVAASWYRQDARAVQEKAQ